MKKSCVWNCERPLRKSQNILEKGQACGSDARMVAKWLEQVGELLRTGVLPTRYPTGLCPLGLLCNLVSDMDGSPGGLWISWVEGLPNGQQSVTDRDRGYTAVLPQSLGMGWGWWHQAAALCKSPWGLS